MEKLNLHTAWICVTDLLDMIIWVDDLVLLIVQTRMYLDCLPSLIFNCVCLPWRSS